MASFTPVVRVVAVLSNGASAAASALRGIARNLAARDRGQFPHPLEHWRELSLDAYEPVLPERKYVLPLMFPCRT